MKKLFISFIFAVSFILMATAQTPQTPTVTGVADVSVSTNGSWAYHTGLASDTIGVGDSIWTYSAQKYTVDRSYAGFWVEVDSTGGTGAAITIYLQKKALDKQSWVNTDTVTISTGVDSSFFYESALPHSAQFWRFYAIAANDSYKAKFDQLDWIFIKP